MFDWFRRKSTLRLCYVIMSKDSRFWLQDRCWGGADGRDMCDSQIWSSRKEAERELAKLDQPGTVFEIGLYNGRPVMLVDAYSYWLDANYSKARKA